MLRPCHPPSARLLCPFLRAPHQVNVFRRYLAYFAREKRRLLIGFLCLIPSAFIDLQLPWVVREALNKLGSEPVESFLLPTLALYLGLAALKGVFRFGMRWFLVTSSRQVEANLRNDLFAHLESLSFPYFNRTKTGDLISRATQDVEAVRMFLGPGSMYIGDALLRIPIALILLSQVQPAMLVAIGISLAVLSVSVRKLTPKLHAVSEAQQKAVGAMSDRANEVFGGVRVVKSFAREEAAERSFDEVSAKYRSVSLDAISARALSNVFFSGAKDVTLLILFATGGVFYYLGKATVGDLYLFADYTVRLYWPVFVVGWMVGMYPRARAAAQRLNEVFDTKPEIVDGPRAAAPTEIRGAIEAKHLTFSYATDRPPVLKNLSFKIAPGETVALVGRTGSGKSTLAMLLGRFFPVPPGMLFVDGVDVNDLAIRSLRGAIGYVPQDHFLFSDTIAENIGFSENGPADTQRVARAAADACLEDDVSVFPKRFETEIGERGVTLSGGQRQRVSIARALYSNPRILVLDDCLSAVDSSTEERLLGQLQDAARGRTTLLIAHRLSTVKHAHRILLLEDGGVVEEGSHAELLARKGRYAQLWQRQQLEERLAHDGEPLAAETTVARNGKAAP